jgi:hypothetical protein
MNTPDMFTHKMPLNHRVFKAVKDFHNGYTREELTKELAKEGYKAKSVGPTLSMLETAGLLARNGTLYFATKDHYITITKDMLDAGRTLKAESKLQNKRRTHAALAAPKTSVASVLNGLNVQEAHELYLKLREMFHKD